MPDLSLHLITLFSKFLKVHLLKVPGDLVYLRSKYEIFLILGKSKKKHHNEPKTGLINKLIIFPGIIPSNLGKIK